MEELRDVFASFLQSTQSNDGMENETTEQPRFKRRRIRKNNPDVENNDDHKVSFSSSFDYKYLKEYEDDPIDEDIENNTNKAAWKYLAKYASYRPIMDQEQKKIDADCNQKAIKDGYKNENYGSGKEMEKKNNHNNIPSAK